MRTAAEKRAYNSTFAAKRRAVLRLEGLCERCGLIPPLDGIASCESCRAKYLDGQRQSRLRKKALGLCLKCPSPAISGQTQCETCAEYNASRATRNRLDRQASGMCTYCGKTPAAGPSTRCETCKPQCRANVRRSKQKRHLGFRSQYPEGAVYFIAGGPCVKIGKTTVHPQTRLKELQCGSPVPLILLGFVPGAKNERELQDRFRHLHSHGEHYRAEPELLEWIETNAIKETQT